MQKRPAIVAKVAQAGGIANFAVTTITIAELRYGIEALPEGRRKRKRVASLDMILEHGPEILPFNEDAAAVFGWAGALLKGAGIPFDFPDLAIASVALIENKTMVSNDGFFDHAQRVCGLKFERWEP